MKRQRKGVFGSIVSLFTFLIVLGIFIAVLKQFNWDLGAACTWVWDMCAKFVDGVANYFSHLPAFEKLFKN